MFDINNRFDFFDEPIKMFSDNEIDFYFEKDRRDFKDNSIKNIFNIRQVKYDNYTIQIKFDIIKNYINFKDINKYDIKNYVNLQNFCFERLGRKQFPPKRIIIKGFDD